MLTNDNTVDDYLRDGCGRCSKFKTMECKVHHWKDVLTSSRSLLQTTDLKEEIKWGQPVYTWNQKTAILLSAYKDHVVLSFFKGSLLSDPSNLLTVSGPNSHVARILKIDSVQQLDTHKKFILSWIEESKLLIEQGVKSAPAPKPEHPTELTQAFEFDEEYQTGFNKLTPGRQRSYLLHFNGAKQSTTRQTRIAKCRDKVLSGKGFNER